MALDRRVLDPPNHFSGITRVQQVLFCSYAMVAMGSILALTSCKQRQPSSSKPAVSIQSPSISPNLIAPTTMSTMPATAVVSIVTTQPSPYQPINNPHLHNAHRVTDKVISGAQPDDEEAFQALQALGVKTIISVDGAKPNIAMAKKYGMQYVHRPTRYDTVTREDAIAVAKAIKEYPGLIYLHCHHGKHRSAATLAVACVYSGDVPPDRAEAILQTFGTGKNYAGLWKAAREARPLEPGVLENTKVKFVETAETPAMALAMVSVDQHWDQLKLLQKAGWKPTKEHPDLDPAHEALQLQEQLHEIGRTEAAKAHPSDFQAMLADAEKKAARLNELLKTKPIDTVAVDALAKEIGTSCTTCHKAYRD